MARKASRVYPHLVSVIGVALAACVVCCYGKAAESNELKVECVPWLGKVDWQKEQGARYYHRTWSGQSVSLKGTVRFNGIVKYQWEYGDGQKEQFRRSFDARPFWPRPAPITGERHAYRGEEGDRFIARLRVWATVGGQEVEAVAEYPIVIVRREERRQRWIDRAEIDVAVDEALWWLYSRPTLENDGAYWGSGTNYFVAHTAAAVQAFELNGHLPAPSVEADAEVRDPYVDVVVRGLNHILSKAQKVPVSDRATNDNGYGLTCFHVRNPGEWNAPEMYEVGFAMMALAGSRAPLRRAAVGELVYVRNRPYRDVLQDMVDFCAYAQNTSEGGWRYKMRFSAPSPVSDNSATQWPILGLRAGEVDGEWGIKIPSGTKGLLVRWLSKCQSTTSKTGGGFTYGPCLDPDNEYSGDGWVNVAKTAGTGITGYVFARSTQAQYSDKIRAATDYIVKRWDTEEKTQGWPMNKGCIYAMYAVSKAFSGEFLQPGDLQTRLGFDWQRDYALYLIQNMAGDHWGPLGRYGISPDLTTALAIQILSEGVRDRPPIAVVRAKRKFAPPIEACDAGGIESKEAPVSELHVDANVCVLLDASFSVVGSYPFRKYEWAFDRNPGDPYPFATTEPYLSIKFRDYKADPTGQPYKVWLRVTDTRSDLTAKEDLADEDTCLVYVHPPPHAPTAIIRASKLRVCVGEGVELDGGESYDPNPGESVAKWEWTIDGVRACSDPCPSKISGFAWSEPGSHVVRLRVRSIVTATGREPELAESQPTSVTIEVSKNPAPEAWIWCERFDGGTKCSAVLEERPIVVQPGEEVALSGCYRNSDCDAVSGPVACTWDRDGDGVFGDAEGTAVVLRSEREAVVRVGFRATDSGGMTGTATRYVRWTCEKPTPVMLCRGLTEDDKGKEFTVPPIEECRPKHAVCVGSVLSFDASKSHVCGSQQEPLIFLWDLDGDGQYDDATGSLASLICDRQGRLEIGLRVQRADGTGAAGEIRRCVAQVLPCAPFIRGDTNADGRLDIADATCILHYLFLGNTKCLWTSCWAAADVNDDGQIAVPGDKKRFVCEYALESGVVCREEAVENAAGDDGGSDISDALYLLNFLFLGGPPPRYPYPDCGTPQPLRPGLGCNLYPGCR